MTLTNQNILSTQHVPQLPCPFIMSLEAILTRELNIRFIDARAFVVEAKVKMGIDGYPSGEQEEQLIKRVIKLCEETPEDVRNAMRRLKTRLDDLKVNRSRRDDSDKKNTEDEDASGHTESVSDISEDMETLPRRSFKFWKRR